MKKFIKDNWVKVVWIIAILIVLYVIYSTVEAFKMVDLENKEIAQTKIEMESLKCPDEYATPEERQDAFRIFAGNQEDTSKMLELRKQFFIDKKCEKALVRLDMYLSGLFDFEFTELFDRTYESELGFSFEYPYNYSVNQLEDGENDIVITPFSPEVLGKVYSGEEKKFSEESFIMITARNNPKDATAMDWLKSEYSGYNFDNEYQEKLVGDINVLLLRWRNPNQIDGALFLTPDGKYRVSIVATGDKKALEEDLYKIVNTFLYNKN